MHIHFIRQIIHLVLCFTVVFAPTLAWPQEEHSLRLLIETEIPDNDSTRFTIDFGEMTFDELGRLPEKMADQADILPDREKPLTVFVFVPASLQSEERENFIRTVQQELSKTNPHLNIQVSAVDIDVEVAERDQQSANQRIRAAQEELAKHDPGVESTALQLQEANHKMAADLRAWEKSFEGSASRYKNWIKGGYTKEKDERVGGWIGKARGMASAAVWFGFNKASWATAFQIPASFFLDWFFSKYERRVDIFKATHRIPLENIPVIKHAVRFYNERPLLKSWVIGNLIGFGAGSYFRFWSWMENPERTSAPWSFDALATYSGAWSIGNLAAAYGAQGPRILRKKGYISSRTEYYIYVSYGIMFQIGGWFYGLGWNTPVLAMATGESVLKVGLYTYGRLRPFKEPRAVVLHPALAEREVNELLYRVGLEKSETTPISKPDFAQIVGRLKQEMTVTWKQKVSAKIKSALNTCENLLSKKDESKPL